MTVSKKQTVASFTKKDCFAAIWYPDPDRPSGPMFCQYNFGDQQSMGAIYALLQNHIKAYINNPENPLTLLEIKEHMLESTRNAIEYIIAEERDGNEGGRARE